MKLTEQQIKALSEALEQIKSEEQTNEVKANTESSGDSSNKPDRSISRSPEHSEATEGERERVKESSERTEGIKKVKLGTPSNSNMLSADSLNGKSVEWMANNLDEVNKLIENS